MIICYHADGGVGRRRTKLNKYTGKTMEIEIKSRHMNVRNVGYQVLKGK